jgi:hypothetical protein
VTQLLYKGHWFSLAHVFHCCAMHWSHWAPMPSTPVGGWLLLLQHMMWPRSTISTNVIHLINWIILHNYYARTRHGVPHHLHQITQKPEAAPCAVAARFPCFVPTKRIRRTPSQPISYPLPCPLPPHALAWSSAMCALTNGELR